MSYELRKMPDAARHSLRNLIDAALKEASKILKKSEENRDIAELDGIREKIEYAHEQLKTLNQVTVDTIQNADELQAALDEIFAYDMSVVQILCKIRNAVNQANRSARDAESENRSEMSQGRFLHARLPQLEVPKFKGDYMEWQSFWDAFNSAVAMNPDLTKIQKLQYLLSYLEGEAKKVVEGYRLTEANYEAVVEVLKEKYGDEEIAICMHFEKLFAMQSGDSSREKLSDIYHTCERHIRSLIALGLEESTFGRVFVPLILSKLPKHIRVQLHRNNQGKPWQLAELRSRLREEIKFREMSETYVSDSVVREKRDEKVVGQDRQTRNNTSYNSNYQTQGRFSDRNRKPWDQTRNTLVISRGGQGSSGGYCYFCDQRGHASSSCCQYVTRDERINRLVELRACYRCLKPGHTSNHCEMVIRPCAICREFHHMALCDKRHVNPEQVIPSKDGSGASGEQGGERSGPSTGVKQGETVAASNFGQNGAGSSVKVQMELAQVRFQDGIQAYIYFDKGSTSSYMTKCLVQRLENRWKGNTVDWKLCKWKKKNCGVSDHHRLSADGKGWSGSSSGVHSGHDNCSGPTAWFQLGESSRVEFATDVSPD